MAYENSVYEYNENGELCVRVTGAGGGGGGAVSSVNGKTGAVVLSAEDVGAVKHETDYELPSVLKMDDSGTVIRIRETGSIVEKTVMTYDGPDPNATYDPQVGGMVFEIVNENMFVNFLVGEDITSSLEKNIPQNFRVVLRNGTGGEYPYSIDVYNDNGDKIYTKDDYWDDQYLEDEVGLKWNPNLGSGDYPILSPTSTGFVVTIEKKDVKVTDTQTIGILAPNPPDGLPDCELVIYNGEVQWRTPPVKSIGVFMVTLRGYNWANNTQVADTAVITPDTIVIVSPDPNSQTIYTNSGIKCVSQGTGTLTFQCDEQPDNDVMVNVLYINK